tara:strand:+ start:101 stop:943 length:843 start_codon:yes stop_codon:yes gene_type:complete
MNNNPELNSQVKSNTPSVNPPSVNPPSVNPANASPSSIKANLSSLNPFTKSKNDVNIPSGSESGSESGSGSDIDTGSDSDVDVAPGSGNEGAPVKKDSSMMFKILFGITILGLIGINLFGYAGTILDRINDFTGPILRKLITLFGFYTTETVKTTIGTAAEGTKLLADTTKNVTTSVIDTAQQQTANLRDELDETDADITSRIRNQDIIPKVQKRKEREAIIDNDGNPITNKQTSGVEGWCYIGSDNSTRQCVAVGASDTCISGEIFPTNEICVNPSLRY